MTFVLRKMAKPGELINPERINAPHAPGAVVSPQIPGQVPDRSTVPGEGVLPVPLPETTPRPPLTEFGTAQRIMGVYEPKDGNEDDPTRFEQAPISYEEQRKAYPALRTPLRPQAGYALADGTRQSTDQVPALAAPGVVNEVPRASRPRTPHRTRPGEWCLLIACTSHAPFIRGVPKPPEPGAAR